MDNDRRSDELNDASGNEVFLDESEKQAPGGFVAPEHTDEHGEAEGATHDEKAKAGLQADSKATWGEHLGSIQGS